MTLSWSQSGSGAEPYQTDTKAHTGRPVSTAGLIESVTVEVRDYLTPTSYTTCYDVSWTGVDGHWATHNIPLPLLRKYRERRIYITDQPSVRSKETVALVTLIADDDGKVRALISPAHSPSAYPMPIKQGWRYLGQSEGPVFTRPLAFGDPRREPGTAAGDCTADPCKNCDHWELRA